MAERFYDELRTARLARGVELKEVARATRISIRVLEAIESGNLQILPGAYVRAFLRDYATYLGLNPTTILAGYDASRPAATPTASPQPSRPQAPKVRVPTGPSDREIVERQKAEREAMDRKRIEREHPRPAPPPYEPPPAAPSPAEASAFAEEAPQRIQPMKPPRVKRVDTNLTAIIAGAIVVLTGFVLIYFFVAGDGNDKKLKTVTTQAPPPPIVPQYTPPTVNEQKAADTSPGAAPQPQAQGAQQSYPADALTLEAATSDSVWMSVVGDTAHLQRGVVQKGQHITWHAKSKFLVTVGNSSLVTLTLNGKKLTSGDANSRVLRNCVITAATTVLVPGEAPTVVPSSKTRLVPAPQKRPPVKQAPVKPAPAKQVPPKPSGTNRTPAAGTKPVLKGTPPSKPAAGAKSPSPNKKNPEPKRKIKLKPFPDTIEKVQIK